MNGLQLDGKTLDRHNSTPFYQQITDILSTQIKKGIIKPGDQLPTESELMRQFDVSRYVVRQTFNNLARQGLIFTEQGRGSFVSYHKVQKPLDVLQSYHRGMENSGLKVEVTIINKALIHPSDEIAECLELQENETVFFLERVAFLDNIAVNILNSYIPTTRENQAKLMQFSSGSLYHYLQKNCGINLRRSHNDMEVIFAGEYESRLLNIPRGTVLLDISGVVYDQSNKPVEYSRVIYLGSFFRFRYESYFENQTDGSKSYIMPTS